jgi:dTDP-4-dehydrorhamnose reductase
MSEKRVLIIGGTGMLGHKLVQTLSEDFYTGFTIRSSKTTVENTELSDVPKIFDNVSVENIEKIEEIISNFSPLYVINAVGVIKQLPESKNDLAALNINSIFPQNLADLAERHNFKLINISTDCVFSGKKGNYNEADFVDAEDLYGKSKFLGEVRGKNCLTIRTSIIGREIFTNHSLLEWFLSVRDQTVKGFTKAIFSGFPTIVLSDIIKMILQNHPELEGLYHVSSEPINKYELLCLIKDKFNLKTEIIPYDDFVIDRSLDSTRFKELTGFKSPSWEEMIERMADDPTPYDKWRQ